MDIEIKILDVEFYKTQPLPAHATQGSAAVDLVTTRDLIILPNTTQLVGTGLAIHIKDPNICALILPRSGLGHKEGLVLGNLTGLIDSDYTGEIKLSMWNRSEEVRYYSAGDRVAQLMFAPVIRPTFVVVQDFNSSTLRGENGFGSSGP
jgi:dUTP pyrophosphatase